MALLALLTFIVFSVAAVLFYLGKYNDKSPMSDFYNHSVPLYGYEKFRLEITPSWWTWWIWAAVFGWQLPWIFYSFIVPCRKHPPRVFSMSFFIIVSLGFGFTAGWVLLWARELIEAAFGLMAGASLCMYISLAIVFYRVKDLYETTKRFPSGDHLAIQLFLINGLALFASWATYSAFLHLGIVFKYSVKMDDHIATTIVLAGLSAVIFFWFMLDNFVFYDYTLYTFTVYPAMLVGFTGTFARFWDKKERNSIFNVVLLGVCGLLALLKILFMICRTCLRRKRQRSHVVTEERYDMHEY